MILALSGSLYIFIPLLLGDMGILKYFQMLKTEHQISNEIQVLIHENEQLQKQVDLLKSDPMTIERIARQQLGLVKKGELVYRFSTREP